MSTLKISGPFIDNLSKKLDVVIGTSFVGKIIKPVLLQFLGFLMNEVVKLIEAELNEIKKSVEKLEGGDITPKS